MKKRVFLILLLLPVFLSARTEELSRLKEIFLCIESSPEETLVVFDIDNTLLKSTQQLGSVAWGDFVTADLEKKGITSRDAQEIESIFWMSIQPRIKVQAVDPDTADVIQEIQARKIPVMCLTARKPMEAECTASQLASIGVDLSGSLLHTASNASYQYGILFATPTNKKSDVFISFIKENNLKLTRVIFIDDKLGHVQDMHDALKREGIECIGMRFTGADEDLKQFDPRIAEIQWKALPELLSDEQARLLLPPGFESIET